MDIIINQTNNEKTVGHEFAHRQTKYGNIYLTSYILWKNSASRCFWMIYFIVLFVTFHTWNTQLYIRLKINNSKRFHLWHTSKVLQDHNNERFIQFLKSFVRIHQMIGIKGANSSQLGGYESISSNLALTSSLFSVSN